MWILGLWQPIELHGLYGRRFRKGKAFGKNTASPPGEDDFSAKPEGSRPCRPKRSVCQLCPVVPGLPIAVYALFSFRPCSRYPCPHKVWNTKQGRSWGQPCSARYYSGLYAAFVSFPDIVCRWNQNTRQLRMQKSIAAATRRQAIL